MWLARGSDEIELDTMHARTGWLVMPGAQGLDIPATTLLDQRAAGQWGSYRTGVDVPPREVFLPLHIKVADLKELLAERDRFNALTSPYTDEAVRLSVARPGGEQRWIAGFRTSEPPTWDRARLGASGSQRLGLELTCTDPWWRGTPQSWSWVQGAQPDFFDPRGDGTFLPLILAADRLLGAPVSVPVPGAVPASPRWTITGPASSVTATHVESGRSWTVDAALAAGEQLVVDTDPRVASTTGLSVVGPGGSDWFQYLDPPFDLWPLPVGPQTVTVELTGSGEGSAATLEVTPLYETA